MNKTVFKIFGIFVLSAAFISTLLLAINAVGIALLSSDTEYDAEKMPGRLLSGISESYGSGTEAELPEGWWSMLIDVNGNVVWEQDKPADVPDKYTINDIAAMTRWYLNDYPVYVRTEDSGLFVLGKPKNSVGKYEIEYSMDWFYTLPKRMIYVLALNLLLAAAMALIFGMQLYRRLKSLMDGINDLRREKTVKLKERGIFREVCQSLNQTSRAIERKNAALSMRDSARSNWVAGISHDIRTPLSVITVCSEALSGNGALTEESRKKAEVILSNSIKIKRLIDDLNLISSMEYDMQPSGKAPVRICPLIRRAVTELINNGLSDSFSVEPELKEEKAVVLGDEKLLERAVFNIINNAVSHNPDGCRIMITEDISENNVCIVISDNGTGVPDEVIEGMTEIPKTAHGLGLPMAYRIVKVHGGDLEAYNDNGFTVRITLPLK